MGLTRRLMVIPLLLLAPLSCVSSDPIVEFSTTEGYTFSRSERRTMLRIAAAAVLEARRLLPALPRDLVIRVQAGKDVIPETGETAAAVGRRMVIVTINPQLHGGVLAIVERHLRATLFHELHHLARGVSSGAIPTRSIMDLAIHEGMATAFERDFADADYPWGQYPEGVPDWVAELRTLPNTAHREHWMFRHPDGRRWIGFKAGTYLVDRAIRATGLSAAELISVPSEELFLLATPDEVRGCQEITDRRRYVAG